MLLGMLIMILAPVLFYLFIFLCVNEDNGFSMEKPNLGDWQVIGIILAGMVILSYMIIKQNNYIYFWDYGREWKSAISLKARLMQSPVETLKWVYWSINNEDYNGLMPLLITFPMYICGDSFKIYVVLVEIFYMCPAVVVIALLIKKTLLFLQIKKTPSIRYIVFVVSLTPILHYVLFDGFMDPPVLMLVCCVLLLSVNVNYNQINVKRDILLAISLTLLVLFRRHFAYFVVGYLCSQIILVFIQFLQADRPQEIIKGYFGNIFITGSISLAFLLAFFRDFLYRSIFNNFSIAYKAYDVTLYEKLARIPEVFGWVVIVLITVVCLYCIFKIKKAAHIIVPLWVNIVITTVLLWRILQMNYHQYYLVLVPVMLLGFIGLCGLLPLGKENAIHGVLVGVSAYVIINFCCMYWPVFRSIPCKFLFTQRYYEPKIRGDIEEIEELVADLNEISANNPSSQFYTLASSGILNYNVISMSALPDSLNAVPAMSGTHDVDLRDGFPGAFLTADYLVVADPVQTHLPVDTQKIITYLAEQVLDDESIVGKYYEYITQYSLDNSVQAKLYKRIKPLGRDVYSQLFDYYNTAYPDQPELFANRLIYPEPFFPASKGDSVNITWDDGILSSQFEVEKVPISNGEGFLIYGPYKKIEAGCYTIDYEVIDTDNNKMGEKIGYVDIFSNGEILTQADIISGKTITSITHFEIPMDYEKIEFRVYTSVPGIQFEKITVTRE